MDKIMKTEIKIPSMGESITEATIGTILKDSGSIVKADDEILEIETDKVNQVLFAPQAGTIQLSVKKDDIVKIGQIIGYIEDNAGGVAPPTSDNAKAKKAPQEPEQEIKKEEIAAKPKESSAVAGERSEDQFTQQQHSVRLKKDDLLKDLQGDFTKVKEQVPEQASNLSTSQTVPRSAEKALSVSNRETRRPMSKIRSVIASRMVESLQTTAMLTTFNEVDLSEIIRIREKFKDQFFKINQAKLGFMSFFVKAVVYALKQVPDLNSYIDKNEIVHREYYDIGVAVGTDKGVIVPILRDSDKKSFAEIEQGIELFAKRAREGKITYDELKGGGFTITNGGIYGSLLSTPILSPSQSGILGMHKIEKRPVVVDDQIVIRPMMYLALSYDHRIVDGKEAVTFLVNVKNCLEDPTRLLMEF